MGIGVGLDLGTDSIKLVQVRTSPRGVSILSAARIPRPTSGEFPAAAVLDALRRAGLPRRATLGFSGRGLMLRYVPMPPVPPWRLRMLVEYEIAQNVAQSDSGVASDYRPLNLPIGLAGELVVLAAVAKIPSLEGAFGEARSAGIKPSRATPAAIALYRGFAASGKYREGETTLLLDVGRENVEMAIQRDGELFFARNGSGSGTGEKITAGIDAALGLGRERAEEYKCSKVLLTPAPPAGVEKRQLHIYSALREAGDALAGAVSGGLRFARIQTKIKDLDFDRVVLTGGGARLAGLKDFLQNRLKKPVSLYDPAAALDSSRLGAQAATAFDGAPSSMAVATGLAVMDAEREGFIVELLPPREAASREFWSRRVFAHAGVFLAIVLAGAMVVGSRLDLASARSERDDLRLRLASLDARSAAAKSLEEENLQRAGELLPLVGQSRMNRAILEFLPLLRRTCPEGLNLTHLQALPADESADTVVVVLEGLGKGEETVFLDRLKAFRAALAEGPEVVSIQDMRKQPARLRPASSGGGPVHGFRCELTLRPWARGRAGGG